MRRKLYVLVASTHKSRTRLRRCRLWKQVQNGNPEPPRPIPSPPGPNLAHNQLAPRPRVILSCISRRAALWRSCVTKSKARLPLPRQRPSSRSIPSVCNYGLPSSYSRDPYRMMSSPFLSQDEYFFDWLNDSLAYRMPSTMLFNNDFCRRSSPANGSFGPAHH